MMLSDLMYRSVSMEYMVFVRWYSRIRIFRVTDKVLYGSGWYSVYVCTVGSTRRIDEISWERCHSQNSWMHLYFNWWVYIYGICTP